MIPFLFRRNKITLLVIIVTSILSLFCDKRHDITTGYTIILNHSREWDGKPTGSLRDSRVAEMPNRYEGPGFFISKRNRGSKENARDNSTEDAQRVKINTEHR